MDRELLSILAYTFGTGGYAIGGWRWKWIRRELTPAIWGLLLLVSGFTLWKVLLFIILQDLTFRLPYGEKTPYWVKTIVGISYAMPSLLFGLSFWQLVVPVVFISYFALSNWKPTASTFSWKICEGTVGFQIGIIVAHLILSGGY